MSENYYKTSKNFIKLFKQNNCNNSNCKLDFKIKYELYVLKKEKSLKIY